MTRATTTVAAFLLALAPPLAAAHAEPSGEVLAAEAALRSSGLPRAVPAGRQSAELVNDEIVVSQLDPRGLPIESQLISRISSPAGEERTIEDPSSTANVVYLNQRGRPEVTADGIEIDVGGPEPTTILTEALVDKPLAVAMHAEYRLNGEVVDPEVIVGGTGALEVRYTVTNTDVKQKKLTYTNALGQRTTEKQPVFAPFVGTLTASLPEAFEATDTSGAIVTTDREGNTILMWNLLLYPPMGSYQQTVKFSATIDNGSVPGVLLNVVPVDQSSDPSLEFTTDLFEKTLDGNEQLASGLEQLNNQTAQLAEGAGQLATGIGQLADGTNAIALGFNEKFVPGTQQLASGAGAISAGQQQLATGLAGAATGADQLATGTEGLATGLDSLADGIDQLASKYPELVGAAEQIRNGADALADAVGSPDDKPVPVPSTSIPAAPTPIPTPDGTPVFPSPSPTPTNPTLEQAVGASVVAAQALAQQTVTLNNNLYDIYDGLSTATTESGTVTAETAATATELATLYPTVCPPPASSLTAAQCDQLRAARDNSQSAADGSADLTKALTDLLTDLGTENLRAYLIAAESNQQLTALRQIQAGVALLSVALRSDSTTSPGLVEGLDQLVAGLKLTETALEQLDTGSAKAASGAGKLSEGTTELADGLGKAATGSAELAAGTAQFAEGASALAFGTAEVGSALTQLAGGADAAASGSAQFATGIDMLQRKGTAKIYEGVVKSSDQPALAVAYLNASADRATSALPYGLPDDATGSVAYVMTMEPVVPSGSSQWQLAAIALVLIAAGGGAVLKTLASHRGR